MPRLLFASFFMVLLFSGQAIAGDKATARKALSGDPEAQMAMCLAYWSGDGVGKNLRKARDWCIVSLDSTVKKYRPNSKYFKWYMENGLRTLGNIYYELGNRASAKAVFTICAQKSDHRLTSSLNCQYILEDSKNYDWDGVANKRPDFVNEDLDKIRQDLHNDPEVLRLAGKGSSDSGSDGRRCAPYTGPSNDPQVDSYCKAAYTYRCNGNPDAAAYQCEILGQYGKGRSYCPYCAATPDTSARTIKPRRAKKPFCTTDAFSGLVTSTAGTYYNLEDCKADCRSITDYRKDRYDCDKVTHW